MKGFVTVHLHTKKRQGIIHPEGKGQQTETQIYRKAGEMVSMWVNI